MQNVFVPLNAFNRFEVMEKGQASFVELIAKSGGTGVEIRRELLPAKDTKLNEIHSEIDKYGLLAVYSAPIELWLENHQFNLADLVEVFQEGRMIGAQWIKVSLGHYKKGVSDFSALGAFLHTQKDIQLLVENDQTLHGGNIAHLKSFFEGAFEQHLPIKMTFDSGNWYYSDQDVYEALSKLSDYVLYVHLKQVEEGPVTVPLQPEGNQSWRSVIQHFPSSIVKALEFPIEPKEKLADFIRLVTDIDLESEAIVCSK